MRAAKYELEESLINEYLLIRKQSIFRKLKQRFDFSSGTQVQL